MFVASLCSFFAACLMLDMEWFQFRGARSDGHAEGVNIPAEWSDTKNVLWKKPIEGLGWSSPVVVGDRVYLTTAVTEGDRLTLKAIALDANSGELAWQTDIRSVDKVPSIHAKNSHASPTPIVQDGSVFVHFGALGMARLSAQDGKIQWTCLELEYPPMHGSGGSPMLHDGKLIVACDGSTFPFVAAVDAKSGKVAWKTERGVKARMTHSFVTAAIANVDGRSQVMAPGPDHMAAYDVETGKEIWRVLAHGWSVVPQPTVSHGMVIYNHDYDNPELIAVKLGGQGDVTDSHIVWRQSRGAPSTPSPLLINDELYIVSDKGIASCLDVRTGEKHWTERLGGDFSASPILVNDKILFLNETGRATWVKPSKRFESLGRCEVPGRTLATPGFSADAMYLRTDEYLYKIGNK